MKKPNTSNGIIGSLNWKVHTPNLLQEILTNEGAQLLTTPLNILRELLLKVGKRAAELNDPELNALMCRLTIYSIADPDSVDYDHDTLEEIYKIAAMSSGTHNK